VFRSTLLLIPSGFFALTICLVNVGLSLADVNTSVLLRSMEIVSLVVLAYPVMGERPSLYTISACLLLVFGVGVISWDFGESVGLVSGETDAGQASLGPRLVSRSGRGYGVLDWLQRAVSSFADQPAGRDHLWPVGGQFALVAGPASTRDSDHHCTGDHAHQDVHWFLADCPVSVVGAHLVPPVCWRRFSGICTCPRSLLSTLSPSRWFDFFWAGRLTR
jgi:hypothetical protein